MANETVTVSKGTASAIMANGAACGGASASTTDLIVVNGNGVDDTLVIDLGGGYFEPGATAEVAGHQRDRVAARHDGASAAPSRT